MSTQPVDLSKVMTVQEVADYLKVSEDFVTSHASGRRRPVLVGVKLGPTKGKGLWRFLEADVHEFILKQRQG